MTDEEFGRAWAKQMGLVPMHLPDYTGPNKWGWWECYKAGQLPHEVRDQMLYFYVGGPTERWAFSSLGRAVRAVHAAVPPLAEGGT